MPPKTPFLFLVLALAGADAASAALSFPFTNTAVYRAIDYMDGNQGTQWSAYGKVGTSGSVTDYSATAPDGSTGTVRQIGIGSDFGAGGTERGYLFSISDGTDNYFTPFVTFSSYATTSVTWDMGNSTNTFVRLLVQSEGNWYATQTGYTTANTSLADFKTSPIAFSVTLATATWYAYDMTTLTVDTSTGVSLPGTDLTGVGFHMVNSGDNAVARLDNLTIVPEASSVALLLPGLLTVLRRRRA